NGQHALEIGLDQIKMRIKPVSWVNLVNSEVCELDQWRTNKTVHAVAGIGNPNRFFSTLRSQGFEVLEHAFIDHHSFSLGDVSFGDTLPVIMTEKDAVKIRLLNPGLLHDNFWYLKIDIDIDHRFKNCLENKLKLYDRVDPVECEESEER
ncbi:MAG: tetraacyldisaccharide 4'-kinase, partial [Gammaproteobacteria bacterium]|nr:tetraacyldisaccharide 4'-kinase [Gammaproteobacteria bacterium]